MDTHPLLKALDTATAALSDAGIQGLSDDELLAALRSASQVAARIGALEVALAGEADARTTERPTEESLARSLRCRNTIELLQHVTAASVPVLRSRLRLASATRSTLSLVGQALPPRYEYVAVAMTTGQLPLESALLICDTLTRAGGSPQDAAMAQRCLVQTASGVDLGVPDAPVGLRAHAGDVRIICRHWEQALDPDGAEPNEKERLRRRKLTLGREEYGLISISGWILPEVAATLGRIFDAVGSPRSKEAPELHGPMEDSDSRSPAQKRHDIFATVINVAARSKALPTLGGAPITVLIQINKKDLESGQGAGWLDGHDGTRAPVSQTSVRHGACSGAVQLVARNAKGRITKLGTPKRLFNSNQRRAIMLRDGGCIIPGCNVPGAWCEVHHVEPHARGGPTHTDNGVLLCFFHHRTLDADGWDVRMVKGVPQVRAPSWIDPRRAWHIRDGSKYLLSV